MTQNLNNFASFKKYKKSLSNLFRGVSLDMWNNPINRGYCALFACIANSSAITDEILKEFGCL